MPHEITAVSAAIGYSLASEDRLGVVIVHTTPGTANVIGGILNAYTSRIPLLVIVGRSPYTTRGGNVSRNLRVHWTQEVRDQGEMVRQMVKYDFEIRDSSQVEPALIRAYSIAMSEPRGPVYVSIPREVSVANIVPNNLKPCWYEPGVDLKALKVAEEMINEAERPVIVTWRAGRKREWFYSLKNFAERINIPVINYAGEVLNYPVTGKMVLDEFDLSKPDLIIVVESEVPWIPKETKISGRVIRVDVDPLYTHIPYYDFECDLCVQSTSSSFFDNLKVKPKEPWALDLIKSQREKKKEVVEKLRDHSPIHPKYLSYEIGMLGLTVINEYNFDPSLSRLEEFGTYFNDLSAGYLGWVLGLL